MMKNQDVRSNLHLVEVRDRGQTAGVFGRRLGLIGAAWVGAGLVLAMVAMWREMQTPDSLVPIQGGWLALALASATVSFGLRALRWQTLAAAAGARASFATSLRTQLAGFSLTLTPGKVGEIYKCYLMELETGVPTARTAPIVLVEKLMEGIAFSTWTLLAASIVTGLPDTVSNAVRSVAILGLTPVLVGALLHFGRLPGGEQLRFGFLGRLPMAERMAAWASAAIEGARDVVRAPVLLKGLSLTLVARLADGLALTLILRALGVDVPAFGGILAFNLSGTVGGLSMLPGGIAAVEASLILSLMSLGAAPGTAIAAALLSRVLSFWLWVGIGLALLTRASLRPARQIAA
jgi:uncharacterized protein (TIRG00374 family)